MGLRLFFLPIFPGAMLIQEATFIPDSRVGNHNSMIETCQIKHEIVSLGFGMQN